MAFPPATNPVLSTLVPAYLYVQYNDDDNVRAFFDAYNGGAGYYLNWFVTAGLPIYTGLSGSLLDWVAQGLYGMTRPTLEAVGSAALGPYNSIVFNRSNYPYNSFTPGVPSTFAVASDDIFQRIMTWQLYRGDGYVFTVKWLKRRVLRFLKGMNGTAPNVADTSQISVKFTGDIVTINVSAVTGVSTNILNALLYIIQGGIVELPPQFAFQVVI